MNALCVDPASNSMGVSLWHRECLLKYATLVAPDSKAPYSERLKSLEGQFAEWIGEDSVNLVVGEAVRSKIVLLSMGFLFVSPSISCTFSDKYLVGPMRWKRHAQRMGAQGKLKDIKGIKACRDIGLTLPLATDDEADSILMYMAYYGIGRSSFSAEGSLLS